MAQNYLLLSVYQLKTLPIMKILFACILLGFALTGNAQTATANINPALLTDQWPARWITCPNAPQKEYGVYHFRKNFTLAAKPPAFVVHVSADNRYRLLVNGQFVCNGPARGDLYNWYFETVDIAPFLQPGKNTIAALVWNMGVLAPVAQITNQTAFVLQGNGEAEKMINTDASWRVLKDSAYTPCSTDNSSRLRTYMVVGPGDEVDASKYPWGWQQVEYNDGRWPKAVTLSGPEPAGYGTDNLWTLAPRNIPLMEETPQQIPLIRRTLGLAKANNGFLQGTTPLQIPPKTKVQLLLDQTFNTVGYPMLTTSKGKGSSITLTYAEALYNNKREKGNRNEVEGKTMIGNFDIFKPDGGNNRLFSPLWMRTWRYLQVDIVTGNEPLLINNLHGIYTGYPFNEKASFVSNDSSLGDIWKVGWRTARLCAGETYFDCPYYEQLQYEGDTRIQALISLYVSGDDRLMRKAITDFYHSRVPEGLTQGRYPSNRLQVIPPFSLYWVTMLYDYFMHRKDDAFLKQFIQPARGVLLWYKNHLDTSKNILGPMPWWNFTDWNQAFAGGTPDGANDGNSAIISLQYAYTLQQAATLFGYFGLQKEADEYLQLANTITSATYATCYNPGKGVMANTPLQNTYSQHASIMGVLTGAIPASEARKVMTRVLADSTLSQATFYYRFYLTRALKKAGLAEMYYSQLTPWRGMLTNGLTTFAEQPDPTRSDCHAWSSSPNYDFLATICGIMPGSAGFETVNIQPALGGLTDAQGTMPHPLGNIQVSLQEENGLLKAAIVLPPTLTGTFSWKGHTEVLHGGAQAFEWK